MEKEVVSALNRLNEKIESMKSGKKGLSSDIAKFCPHCGEKLFDDRSERCEHCESEISPNDEFCWHCGKETGEHDHEDEGIL